MKSSLSTTCFISICALLLCVLLSCEKEFNPRDKYKDITIVYGLINPVDSVHYIRINKAFLGPESIIVMAEKPDSSLYPVEDIDVRIFEITPDGKSTPLKVGTTVIQKDTGYFYQEQRVYFFERKFEKSTWGFYNLDNTIKIEIELKKSGKIIYAETPLVNSFNIESPMQNIALNLDPTKGNGTFKWDNAKNGRIYDVYYTMYYHQGNVADSSFHIYKEDSLVWHIGSHSATSTGGSGSPQEEKFQFNQGTFYAQLQKKLKDDPNVWRAAHKEVKFSIWCGSEDLYYYHNINNPSQGLTQDRPEYTNLKTKKYSEELGKYEELENEAFGLFASRIVQYRFLLLSPEMIQKHLPESGRQFLKREADEH